MDNFTFTLFTKNDGLIVIGMRINFKILFFIILEVCFCLKQRGWPPSPFSTSVWIVKPSFEDEKGLSVPRKQFLVRGPYIII
jgi:hypothetical protein